MTYKKFEIEKSQCNSKTAKTLQKSLADSKPTIKDKVDPIDHFREGKQVLQVEDKRGKTVDTCATIGADYVCCNVKVLKSVSNCPYECSYCFLQNYLTNGATSVVANIDSMIEEIKERILAQPWRFFRIGTWELGDSLALETLTGQAAQLIDEFSRLPNAILELKTKSDCVDSILSCDHNGRTVVSWSLNTEYIINTEEHKT